jgi:hypothetical protein
MLAPQRWQAAVLLLRLAALLLLCLRAVRLTPGAAPGGLSSQQALQAEQAQPASAQAGGRVQPLFAGGGESTVIDGGSTAAADGRPESYSHSSVEQMQRPSELGTGASGLDRAAEREAGEPALFREPRGEPAGAGSGGGSGGGELPGAGPAASHAASGTPALAADLGTACAPQVCCLTREHDLPPRCGWRESRHRLNTTPLQSASWARVRQVRERPPLERGWTRPAPGPLLRTGLLLRCRRRRARRLRAPAL